MDDTPGPARRWRPTRPAALGIGALAVAVAVGLGVSGRDGPTTVPTPPGATQGTPGEPSPPATGGPDTPTPTAAPPAPPAPSPDPPGPAGEGPGDDPAPGDAPASPPAVPELPPVPLTQEAEFGTEVRARLTEVVRVDGQGQGPGEDSGPAVAVTMEMVNARSEPLDLSFVVVTLLDDAGNPGQVLLGDPRSAPFTGPLAPGGTATGTYVLRLPAADTVGVTVTLSYGAEAPTAVFTGPVPAPPTG